MTARRSRLMKSKQPKWRPKRPAKRLLKLAEVFQAPGDYYVPDPDGLTPIRRSEWLRRKRKGS